MPDHRPLIDAARRDAQRLRAAAPPSAAPAIAGFEIVSQVHAGGQGVVFRAIQAATGRDVAIKIVRGGALAGPGERARFEREVAVLGRLQHPHIVSIHGSGVVKGCQYLVMDFVNGVPLDEYLFANEPSIRSRLELFATICDAINAAHLCGVIHRDLKPGNILIDEDARPHILDFGLAKWTDDIAAAIPQARTVTAAGQFLGSLPWAAPEQIHGRHCTIDLRTDVYALGTILHFMLTDRLPFSADAPHQLAEQILNRDPPPPRLYNKNVPREVQTISLRCLAKDPARRYQSAGELAEDVRRFLHGAPIAARADSTLYVLSKHLRRHKAAITVGAGFVLLVMASAILAWSLYLRADREAAAASAAREEAEAVAAFLVDALRSANPVESQGNPATVEEMLRRAAATVGEKFANRPQLAIRVHATIGETYHALGVFSSARAQLEMAVSLCEDHSLKNVLCASARQTLARVLGDLGDHAQAEALLRRALEEGKGIHGDRHAEVASVMHDLGMILWQAAKLDEAEALMREALTLRREAADDPMTAQSLEGLARFLHTARGDLATAEDFARQALAIQESRPLEVNPRVAEALEALAMIVRAKGDLAEAELQLRRALECRERLYAGHPAVASTRNNLAGILKDLGRYEEAQVMYRQALEDMRTSLGPQNRHTITCANNLAGVLKRLGRLDEAEQAYRDVLSMTPDDRSALNNLGSLFLERQRWAEAEDCYRQALKRFEESLGPQHQDLAYPAIGLGEALVAMERPDEAEPLLQRAIELRRTRLPPQHWLTGVAYSGLGACLAAQGRFDDARTALEQATALLETKPGTDRRELDRARERLRLLDAQTSNP